MALLALPCSTADEIAAFIANTDSGFIYKHSYACDLSHMAIAEVEAFVRANPDMPVWLVDVIAQRSFARAIESVTGVQHESPQMLLVRDGVVVWHASHRRVTQRAILEAWDAPVAI